MGYMKQELVSGGGVILAKIGRTSLGAIAFGNSNFSAPPNVVDMLTGSSRGAIIGLVNAGVAGNTTAAMLARIASVDSTQPLVFVMECTNDAGNSVPTATHVQNMRDICNILMNRGQQPIIILPPPRSDTTANTTRQENLRLADYLLAKALNLPCYDPWSFAVDPATSGWVSQYNNASDGLHIILAGNGNAADALWSLMSAGYCTPPNLNRGNVYQAGLFPTNVFFLTDTNADGVPDLWNTGGSATFSLVSTPASPAPSGAKAFQLSITGSGSDVSAYAIGPSGTVAAGDRLLFTGYYSAPSVAANGVVSIAIRRSDNVQAYAVNYQPTPSQMGLFVCPYTVPAGVTSVAVQISIRARTGTTTAQLVSPQIYNLTAMGFPALF